MKQIVLIREGEKPKYVGAEIRADGSLWAGGKAPLVDGQAAATKAFGVEALKALLGARKYGEIPPGCLAHFGDNPSGLVVMDADDYHEQQAAAREAALTPAQRERREINQVRRSAAPYKDSDPGHYYNGLNKADRMLAEWRAKYPDEHRREQAEKLRSMAARERELAVGALSYDCDGSLSAEARQARHDEMMAKASDYDRQADELSGE